MKVVFDTNVVISGLLWQGLPNKLLKLVKHGKLELCISRSIVEEVSTVLSEAKFSHRIIILNTSVEELIAGLSKLLKIYPDGSDTNGVYQRYHRSINMSEVRVCTNCKNVYI